jgi:hypothetical protein
MPAPHNKTPRGDPKHIFVIVELQATSQCCVAHRRFSNWIWPYKACGREWGTSMCFINLGTLICQVCGQRVGEQPVGMVPTSLSILPLSVKEETPVGSRRYPAGRNVRGRWLWDRHGQKAGDVKEDFDGRVNGDWSEKNKNKNKKELDQ